MLQPNNSRTRRAQAAALRVLAAAGAGLLLFVSFQPRPWWWLAPLGVAALVLTLHGWGWRAGLGLGFVAGLAYMYPLLSWTGEFVGPIGSVPLAVVQAGLVAVPVAAMAWILDRRGGYVGAALLWVAGESLRAVVPFGGFPWAKVAFSQLDGPLVALAAIGGTPLVSLAVSVTGCGLAALIQQVLRPRRPRRLATAGLAVIMPIAGGLVARPLVSTAPEAGQLVVAAVQGNVPRAGLDFNAQRRAVLDNHIARTQVLATDVRAGRTPQPDLVIWPENSSDIDPYTNPDAYRGIQSAAEAVAAPVVVGAVTSEDSLNRGMHFPIGWDPYFLDYMTLRDVYHYPTQHYEHHRRQLTLGAAALRQP